MSVTVKRPPLSLSHTQTAGGVDSVSVIQGILSGWASGIAM